MTLAHQFLGWSRVARTSASNYFILQGVCGGAWWAALALWPSSRHWFVPEWAADRLLSTLAFPDITMFIVGSFVAAWVCRSAAGPASASAVAGITTGAAAYESLLCVNLSLDAGQAWLGPVIMLAATAASAACTWLCAAPNAVASQFREAVPSRASLALRAAAQGSVFWIFFLVLIPWLLFHLERAPELAQLRVAADAVLVGPTSLWQSLAAAILLAGSALGITSSTFIVRLGRGTPLPLASPTQLVVTGPYRFVRNPMAVAGMMQGLAVALFLRSPTVLVYVALGGVIWHILVRPLEEQDLRLRFGEAFDGYRKNVRCWLPRVNNTHSARHAAE